MSSCCLASSSVIASSALEYKCQRLWVAWFGAAEEIGRPPVVPEKLRVFVWHDLRQQIHLPAAPAARGPGALAHPMWIPAKLALEALAVPVQDFSLGQQIIGLQRIERVRRNCRKFINRILPAGSIKRWRSNDQIGTQSFLSGESVWWLKGGKR